LLCNCSHFSIATDLVSSITYFLFSLFSSDLDIRSMGLLGDVVNQVVNSVPIVGHIKGMVHYACGDTERGDAAVRSATRTTVVLGAGVAGAFAGPAGAVAAATAAGAAADLTFYANGEPQLHGIARVIKTPRKSLSWLAAGINVLGDGCLGVSLGVSAGLGVIGLNGSVLEEQLTNVAMNGAFLAWTTFNSARTGMYIRLDSNVSFAII
jgi:hypothetical protein